MYVVILILNWYTNVYKPNMKSGIARITLLKSGCELTAVGDIKPLATLTAPLVLEFLAALGRYSPFLDR